MNLTDQFFNNLGLSKTFDQELAPCSCKNIGGLSNIWKYQWS